MLFISNISQLYLLAVSSAGSSWWQGKDKLKKLASAGILSFHFNIA